MFEKSAAFLAFLAAVCVLGAAQTSKKCDADVLFVIDASSSVEDEFQQQLKLITELGDDLLVIPDAHRVAIAEYSGLSTRVRLIRFGEINSKEDFLKVVKQRLPYLKGTTFTANALEKAYPLAQERRTNVPLVVITVTDGFSFDDVRPQIKRIAALGSDVFAFAVSINVRADEEQLLWLANGNKQRVLIQPNVVAKARDALAAIIACDPNRQTRLPPATTATKATATAATQRGQTTPTKGPPGRSPRPQATTVATGGGAATTGNNGGNNGGNQGGYGGVSVGPGVGATTGNNGGSTGGNQGGYGGVSTGPGVGATTGNNGGSSGGNQGGYGGVSIGPDGGAGGYYSKQDYG